MTLAIRKNDSRKKFSKVILPNDPEEEETDAEQRQCEEKSVG